MKRRAEDNPGDDTVKTPDRAAIWSRARGMWKNRKPDPIEELNKMREEWEERLREQEKIWRRKH